MKLARRYAMPLITAVVMLALAGAWLARASFPEIDRLQFNDGAWTAPVSRGHSLVQTFRAPADSLSRIDLKFDRAPGPGGSLRLELFELKPEPPGRAPLLGRRLAVTAISEQTFVYEDIRRFDFSQALLTPGKTYAFRLSSNDSAGHAVKASESFGDVYHGGGLYIDGEPTGTDLYFGLFHNTHAGSLLARIAPWRPWPLRSAAFYSGLFLGGAALFGWLLWGVAAAVPEARRENNPGPDRS